MIAMVRYALKRKITDKSTLINMVALPLLLILILGNALAPTFKTDSASSSARTSLVVVDLDGTQQSADLRAFVNGLRTTFTISTADTLSAGEHAISSGSADVLLCIDSGYGAAMAAGRSGAIRMSAVDSNIDHLRAAQIAVDTYSDVGMATTVATTITPTPKQFALTSAQPPAKTQSADPASGVSGITYYSVTMLILILIYGMSNTMNYIKEEYEGPLGDRYLTTPTPKFTLIAAQLVAGVLSSLIQAVVLVLAAVLAFRADLGKTPWVAAAVIGVAVVLFNSIGLLFGLLGRTRPWIDPLVSLLIPAMTFLGGGFVKLDFGGLENYSINKIFQNGLFREIAGMSTQWQPLWVCLAVAAGSLIISAALLNRTEAR